MRSRTSSRRPWGLLGLLTLAATLPACSMPRWFAGDELRAESIGTAEPVFIEGGYETAYYGDFDETETSVFLTDRSLNDLLSGTFSQGVVIHLDLLWEPSADKTPMDSSATNLSIRYIVFADGEVGVYGGAGFALPKLDDDTIALHIEEATMTLLHATDGFVDLLSPAQLTGSITARRDERRARQMQQAASQLVTNALGRSLIVEADAETLLAAVTRPELP